MDELKRALEEAVLGSVRRWASVGTPTLLGYALLVDGDLQTVFGSCPSQGLLEEEGEAVLFMPFDWDQEDHSHAFEGASRLLATVGGENYEGRARVVCETLVAALEQARDEAPELRGAFLLVASAGGGELWQMFEGESVRRLNGREAFERWKAELA